MNNLCSDIGYKSINHFGENFCGDHVDVVGMNDNSTVIVLSDGLGSGVKASILSTLTSKIISTMIAEGLANETAEIFQYDNPHVIIIRNEINYDYPKTELSIDGKTIYKSIIQLQENDVFIAMSDGYPHAGIGTLYNFGWQRDDIISFMETLIPVGYTAKNLSTILIEECDKLYGFELGDDATACVIKIRKRQPMNILFGPPYNPDDCDRMMSLFFSKEGKHIICGGTTSSIAAKYLNKPLRTSLNYEQSDIPPIAEIEGVDLVTEGVITINRVVEYAKDYLEENTLYEQWNFNRDGASLISRMLFEEATDINFYVGRAINPAHQNPNSPINFSIKMNLVDELSRCLKKMGKKIKVSYF